MKTILLCLLTVALVATAQVSMRPKSRHPLPITFREDGHIWMVNALREYAITDDDPGIVQTDFHKGFCVEVQERANTLVFHDCCTTNILIGTNYHGTIQIGKRFLKVTDL